MLTVESAWLNAQADVTGNKREREARERQKERKAKKKIEPGINIFEIED